MIRWSGGPWKEACELILPWRNDQSLYRNDSIYSSSFITSVVIGNRSAVLVT